MKELKINLHRKQWEVFSSKKQFKLFVAGRRLGKSYMLATSAIHKSLSSQVDKNSLSPPLIVIAAPTYQQVKTIHFNPMVNMLSGLPFVESINKSELLIKMRGKHPDILFRSSEAGERMRGLKTLHFLADEVADMPPELWYEIVLPSLSDSNGTATLIGTPKGKSNWVYALYKQAIEDSSWQYFHGITADNPFFPKEALERAKRQLTPRTFSQEFEASFESFEGQIFDQLQDYHIVEVSQNPQDYDTIYAGMDWGSVHPCITIIGQKGYPPTYTVLDSWSPIVTDTIAFDLQKKKAREFAFKYNIFSTFPDLFTVNHEHFIHELAQLGHAGLRNIDLNAPKLGVMESAEILNRLFFQDRLFLNKNLTQLVDNFKSYHRKKNSSGQFEDKEAPGQFDHEIDCTRYVLSRVEPAMCVTMGLTQ